jgi:hypothetical protein
MRSKWHQQHRLVIGEQQPLLLCINSESFCCFQTFGSAIGALRACVQNVAQMRVRRLRRSPAAGTDPLQATDRRRQLAGLVGGGCKV